MQHQQQQKAQGKVLRLLRARDVAAGEKAVVKVMAMTAPMSASESSPVTAYIGLGANLGEARKTLESALDALAKTEGVNLVRRSSFWGSKPVEATGPDYVNAVAEVHTTLCAPELLLKIQEIENSAGRVRSYKNAPRTLDLDLLLFGKGQIQSQHLTVPHPRMWERAFVLLPLAELAPELVSTELLEKTADQKLWKLD